MKANPGGNTTQINGRLDHQRGLRFIRNALEQASSFGTGVVGKLKKIRMAGKTGTAAWRKITWRTHGWYIGFWPARRPLFCLVVFVHQGDGSHQAAELAFAVARKVESAAKKCRLQ
jgi:cell division protein FtsI/penicillin-binding protein 2